MECAPVEGKRQLCYGCTVTEEVTELRPKLHQRPGSLGFRILQKDAAQPSGLWPPKYRMGWPGYCRWVVWTQRSLGIPRTLKSLLK